MDMQKICIIIPEIIEFVKVAHNNRRISVVPFQTFFAPKLSILVAPVSANTTFLEPFPSTNNGHDGNPDSYPLPSKPGIPSLDKSSDSDAF